MTRPRTGWEPTVFRWAARTLVATTATFTAVALVWGEDLEMDGVAAAASLVVALAAAVTAFAFAAA